ncbi:hypothetical protein G9A89_009284 [Geosiphon pyriformis]|nr:hypothetical protein G9A89_009284 [Geosiphon pyriformis]
MAARNSSLEMVASRIVLVRDPDEVDILAVDRLVAVLLAGNYFDIGLNSDLDNDLEFGTGNRDFNIDFPIVGYLDTGDSPFGYVLVYHNSDRYVFSVATVDWSMKIDEIDFGHD